LRCGLRALRSRRAVRSSCRHCWSAVVFEELE
jgi:hypothetical protein